MKAHGRVVVQLHLFLPLTLDEGQWLDSHLTALILEKELLLPTE